jgi:2-phosphoglycerate kinase
LPPAAASITVGNVTTIAFDTLKLARKLEAAGFPPKQAADTAGAIAESLGEDSNLVTKEDLARLESRLDARLEALKAEILKSMFGTALAQVGAIVALIKLI